VVGTHNISHVDDLAIDFEDLMLEVYKNVEGRLPPALRDNEPDTESTEKELSDDVTEVLNDVDPKEMDCLLSEYVRNGGDEWAHWNPSYRNSESGESLHRNKKSGIWVDWRLCEEDEDGGLLGGFGLVSLFAAERGRIEDPTQELNGEEWVNAYNNLRSKSNLELPELEDADKGIDVDELRRWSQIRDGYKRAYNKTERGKCDQAAADKI
jgi:hypothetical protein